MGLTGLRDSLSLFHSLALTTMPLNNLPIFMKLGADHGWYCDKRQDMFVFLLFWLGASFVSSKLTLERVHSLANVV